MTYEESLRRFRKRQKAFAILQLAIIALYGVTVFVEFPLLAPAKAAISCCFILSMLATCIHSTSHLPILPGTELTAYVRRFKLRHFGGMTVGCGLCAALLVGIELAVKGTLRLPQESDWIPMWLFSGGFFFVTWCLGCGMIHHGLKHKLRVYSEYPDSDPGEDPVAAAARLSSAQKGPVYVLIILAAFVVGLWIWGRLSQ